MTDHFLAPVRGEDDIDEAWKGSGKRYPWSYRVQVVIPHMDTPEPVELAVELWRSQTVRPFICIVDLGSLDCHRERIAALQSDDVEIHYLRGHGYRHPSEPCSVAQDIALARCQQEHQFCTHSDVFPRRRDLLESFIKQCNADAPVVGYEISSRDHVKGLQADVWPGMVGHTATVLHVPTIKQQGITWDYERALLDGHGISRTNLSDFDTEIGFNLLCRRAGITPVIVGTERNGVRTLDDNIDHIRSFGSSKQYSPNHHGKASKWMTDGMREAAERLQEWQASEVTG